MRAWCGIIQTLRNISHGHPRIHRTKKRDEKINNRSLLISLFFSLQCSCRLLSFPPALLYLVWPALAPLWKMKTPKRNIWSHSTWCDQMYVAPLSKAWNLPQNMIWSHWRRLSPLFLLSGGRKLIFLLEGATKEGRREKKGKWCSIGQKRTKSRFFSLGLFDFQTKNI